MLFSIKIRHNKITREAFQGHVQVGISLEQSRPESWNVLWSSSTDLSALEIFSWILLSLLKGFFLCVCVCWEKHWTGMTESKQCMIKEKSRLEMGLRNQTWPLFSIDDFLQVPASKSSYFYSLLEGLASPACSGCIQSWKHWWVWTFLRIPSLLQKNWPRCFLQKPVCLCARPGLGWWGNCSAITVYPLWVKNGWRWDLDQHVGGIALFVLPVLWAILEWVCVSPPWNVLEDI